MSFREKSAWAMAIVMTVAGIFYFNLIAQVTMELGSGPPPPIVIPYIMLIVIGSIVAQSALAFSTPKEATARADERERQILQRAGNWSGLLFSTGAVLSLVHFLVYSDGNILFHLIMASMTLSQISEYVVQIALFRSRA